MTRAWPDECIATMRALLRKGASASFVAISLGNEHGFAVSRHSVVHECNRRTRDDPTWPRLGNRGVMDRIAARREADLRDRRSFTTIKTDTAAAYDTASRRLRLGELERRDCRYPVTDPEPDEPFLFCGHRAEPGKPYCKHHMARAYKTAEPTEE